MDYKIDFPEDRFVVYEKLVRDNFLFLEKSYGFKLSSVEKSGDGYIALRYLSDRVFVNLYYGPPGFELDFYIGRLGIEDQPNKHSLTSGDLLYLESGEKWVGYTIYSAHSYDNLCKCLPKLAELLKECGKDCLIGKSSVYEKILFEQKKDVNQWHKSQELVQARKSAAEAWNNKDYAEVIKLLAPISNDLTPSECKKLEYSRKHL